MENMKDETKRSLIIILVLFLIIGLAVTFFVFSSKDDGGRKIAKFSLTAKDKVDIATTVDGFITTAGTFGGKKLSSTDDFMESWVKVLAGEPDSFVSRQANQQVIENEYLAAGAVYKKSPTLDDSALQQFAGGFYGVAATEVNFDKNGKGFLLNETPAINIEGTFTSTATFYRTKVMAEGIISNKFGTFESSHPVRFKLFLIKTGADKWKIKRITEVNTEGAFSFDTDQSNTEIEQAQLINNFTVDDYPRIGTDGDVKLCVLQRTDCGA